MSILPALLAASLAALVSVTSAWAQSPPERPARPTSIAPT